MLFLGLCAGVGRSDRKRGEEGLVRENDEDGLLMPVRCKPWKVFIRQRSDRDHESCRLHDNVEDKYATSSLLISNPPLHRGIPRAIHTSPINQACLCYRLASHFYASVSTH